MSTSLSAPQTYACRNSKESLHHYRSEFERDRDRILYSKAFRRLSGKTQIFLPIAHDHVRNRLTHTLEVSQIAKVTAKNLNLDSDLAEAIALGHDLGHTPFGHVGERALNLISNNCEGLHPYYDHITPQKKGFKHNLHGLRVACHLEKTYRNQPGMNLTNFTLWGIKNHSKLSWDKYDPKSGELLPCEYHNNGECFFRLRPKTCNSNRLLVGFYDQYNQYIIIDKSSNDAWSFEGMVVAFADEIAQRHHDVEDGLFMKIISIDELKEIIKDLFKNYFDREDSTNFQKLSREKDQGYLLPLISRFIVNLLNKNLINTSKENLAKFSDSHSISTNGKFSDIYPTLKYAEAKTCIGFYEEFDSSQKKFQIFLKNRILNSFEVQRMDGRGTYIIRKLLRAYLTNPKQLSDPTLVAIENIYKSRTTGRKAIYDYKEPQLGKLRDEIDSLSKKSDKAFQISLLRGICDHIAGMTDNFAIAEYKRLYGIDPV